MRQDTPVPRHRPPGDALPRVVAAVFRQLIPAAERDEVLSDLDDEYRWRTASGPAAARLWVWRQALGSVPALLRRSWWRGMTGFEPHANRLRTGGPMFESWIMDARYAMRRVLSRPTYAVLAVLTLALAAGGTAAIFSVVRAILIDPLPIARAEQVGVLWMGGSWREQEFLGLRPQGFAGFEHMAAYRPEDLTLEAAGSPMRLVPGIAVSSEFFDVLGTPPRLGRGFRAGEDVTGAAPVAVLSHALWRDLGADEAVVGKALRLGGTTRTVVGVMPPGFWYPSPTTQIWTTAPMNTEGRAGRYTLVGRIADGQSMEHMGGPLQALGARLKANFEYRNPRSDKSRNPSIVAVRESLVGEVRPSLLATLAAMAAILLIACTNVASLMLGQLDARSTDIAVRAALGADRRRLVRQLVLESLLIGGAAGLAGAAFAVVGFKVVVGALPLGALAEATRLDWTVFWASMAAALLAAALVAIVPGVALWRGSTLQTILSTTRTGGVSGRGGRLEGGLVVAQMALAVLLVASAGLLIRSVANLRGIDAGVRADGLAVLDVTTPLQLNVAERRRALLSVLPALEAMPGVQSAALAQKLPLRGSGNNWFLAIVGKPAVNASTAFRPVSRGYFQTLGIPITRGRDFELSDREGSERVVIINEALAAAYFAGENPIGQVLKTFGEPNEPGERIVGVVANAAEAELTDGPVPARYMLYEQTPVLYNQASIVLRSASLDAAALLRDARTAIGRESSQLAVQEMTTMRHIVELAMGPTAQVVSLVSLLAGLALVLGAVGVYGVISHFVARRSRDFGIRLALGQLPLLVIRHVVGRGLVLVVIGAAVGLAAAFVVSRWLTALLYDVRPTDPLAMAGAVVVLLAVGVIAAFVPARRASRMDPAVVLRQP